MAYRERRFTARDGLFRNARDFDPFAQRLAEGRRVLCPDPRGRGQSDYDPEWRNYRPAIYLDDLSRLLAFANVNRFVAVGTSFAGLLAMALGPFMPFSLAGLVLNDAGPEVER